MLKRAFETIQNVTLSDLEQKLEKPSYTLQTIEYLQEKNPETLYYLCIGEDSLQYFDKWHKYQKILGKVHLLVAERPGFDKYGVNPEILERAIFVEHQPYSISSTTIRKAGIEIQEDLPETVVSYIKENRLYE